MNDTKVKIPQHYEADLIEFYEESKGLLWQTPIHSFDLEAWMVGNDQDDLLQEHFTEFERQVAEGERCLACFTEHQDMGERQLCDGCLVSDDEDGRWHA